MRFYQDLLRHELETCEKLISKNHEESSEINILEKLVSSVLYYVHLDDQDDWGVSSSNNDGFSECLHQLEAEFRDILSDIIVESSGYHPKLKKVAVHFLGQDTVRDSDNLQDFSVVRITTDIESVWGIKITSKEFESPSEYENLFDKLVSLSDNEGHAIKLIEVVLHWSQPSNDEMNVSDRLREIWSQLLHWMFDRGLDNVLFATMLVLHKQFELTDNSLLTKIGQTRDFVDENRFAMVSFSRTNIEESLSFLVLQLESSHDLAQVLYACPQLFLLLLSEKSSVAFARNVPDWLRFCVELTNLLFRPNMSDNLNASSRTALHSIIEELREEQLFMEASSLMQHYLGIDTFTGSNTKMSLSLVSDSRINTEIQPTTLRKNSDNLQRITECMSSVDATFSEIISLIRKK